jgi:hypothetical protein
LPCAGIIGGAFEGPDAVGGGLAFLLVSGIDALPRDAPGLPVLQVDRIDKNKAIDVLRIHQSVADRKHAAGRVPGDGRLVDAQGG